MNLLNKTLNTNFINNIPKRLVHYHVDNTDALKSSHELAQKNPLLKFVHTNKITNNSYQHPVLGRITCDKPHCEQKICQNPCGTIKEQVYVGHVTHSNYPGSVYLSSADFNGNTRPQNGIFYKTPVRNYDKKREYTNDERTKNLNSNKNVQDLIHIYSSRNPLDDENIL